MKCPLYSLQRNFGHVLPLLSPASLSLSRTVLFCSRSENAGNCHQVALERRLTESGREIDLSYTVKMKGSVLAAWLSKTDVRLEGF